MPPRAKKAKVENGCIESPEELERVVRDAVNNVDAIDVHTHLFPPSHGPLMLWGIDELLTYHYLVSEFFMVAPMDITYDSFFALSKAEQAALIWEHLFVKRTPVSEAQLGVLTTLSKLGLQTEITARDLPAIRAWFAKQDPESHVEAVYRLAKIKYVVMTNIPFDPREAEHWLGPSGTFEDPVEQSFNTNMWKTALRIDPLLKGDWGTITACLAQVGLPETFDGAKDYLRQWAKVYGAIYLMASTPADFCYGPADQPKEPDWPTATELIDKVMIPVAEELALPLALKLGAMRGMNPNLNPVGGGDGVVVADVEPLRELCSKNPNVKFLATFLSRVNQHEVCVMGQKFRNLHIYGCWWYCNNPSIIDEITRMRMEMFGTAFTAQHSDCRILEQLVYKWTHSRVVIANILVEQMQKVLATGWKITKTEIERDVWQLFGGSFEQFMAK